MRDHQIITTQEAGLEGFWIHRVLEGEALLRTLMAHKRGEPRVCAMIRAPSPEEEDLRRFCHERKALTDERVAHVNRIKGLLFSQGIANYEPLRKDRRIRLEELRTGDGRILPSAYEGSDLPRVGPA